MRSRFEYFFVKDVEARAGFPMYVLGRPVSRIFASSLVPGRVLNDAL